MNKESMNISEWIKNGPTFAYPFSALIWDESKFINVVLPAPLGPKSPKDSPFSISKLILFTACTISLLLFLNDFSKAKIRIPLGGILL